MAQLMVKTESRVVPIFGLRVNFDYVFFATNSCLDMKIVVVHDAIFIA